MFTLIALIERRNGHRAAAEACALLADSGAAIGEDGRQNNGWMRGKTVAVSTAPVDADALAPLLAAAAGGDRAAFAEVYRATSARFFGIALSLMRRRDLAEEVLQEAYLTIWRKAALYETGKGSAEAWMAAIVRHRSIDRLRAGKRNPVDLAAPEELDNSTAGLAFGQVPADSALDQSLRQCLARLGDKQRQAILLAFYHGMTHEELAAQLDAPLGTVKSWVRRGLIQMKELLDE